VSERARIVTEALRAVNSGAAALLALALAGPAAASVPSTGTLRVLVVLAQFPDRPLAQPRAHFTGAPDALVDRLVAYYREVSSGRLVIAPMVGGPVVTVPRPRPSYVQRPGELARDALDAFAAAATEPADRAALTARDALLVFFAGSGRESHTQAGDANDPWSNYTTMAEAASGGGPPLHEACVIAAEEVAPFGSFGVLCHEFGHLLGLPELYAPGAAAHEGVGIWDLMGQGTWLGKGEGPPHLSAWSKIRLGWADVEEVGETTRALVLPAVETTPRVVKIPAVPNVPEEYYLLENRTKVGADAKLPGEGVLVWHVDERVQGFRSAQNDPRHKLLHLVEADLRGDLDRGHDAGGNRGDAGDPWHGPPRWRLRAAAVATLAAALLLAAAVLRAARPEPLRAVLVLSTTAAVLLAVAVPLRRAPVCGPGTPGMTPYDGGPVRVVLRRFSPAGPAMTLDVLVAPPPTK
jgi:immune inhibitor A